MGASVRFTEREPYEQGFAEIFDREIAPRLDDLETERVARLAKRRVRLMVTIVVTAILAIVGVLVGRTYWPGPADWLLLYLLPSFLTGVGGYVWIQKMQHGHQEAFREILIGPICKFFPGLEYDRSPDDRFDHERFASLGIIGGIGAKFNTAFDRCEDLFIGRHRDTGFKMIDAKVTRSRGKTRSVTIFDGLLFEIDVPASFAGRTLIGRDRGEIGNALKGFFKGTFGKEKQVAFEDAAFEARFAVYSSDPDEAYRLVTPAFCKTMLALAETYPGKSLGAGFVDGVFLIAVPVEGDLFELGSLTSSVHDCEDEIHAFLKEITIAHRVIDILHGDNPADKSDD